MGSLDLDGTLRGFDHAVQPPPAPDRATAVVTLHASGGSSRQWRDLTTALGTDWHVQSHDHIGHGRAAPWLDARPPTLADHAAGLLRTLDALDRPAHLVAHSFGAVVALQAAVQQRAQVRSLTLYEPVLVALLTRHERSRVPEQRVFQAADAVRHAVRCHRPLDAAQHFVTYWSGPQAWSALDSTARATLAARMPAVAGHFDVIESAHALVDRLRELAVPVLLMVGDRTTAAARRIVERLAALLPQARCQVIAGAGHMGPITHTSAVNAQIAAFLHTLHTRAGLPLLPPLHERNRST